MTDAWDWRRVSTPTLHRRLAEWREWLPKSDAPRLDMNWLNTIAVREVPRIEAELASRKEGKTND